jgi:hypothetical protein
MTPVPRVYLPISLTAPGPSGSAEPTRLCRGRSHQHRRSTAPAASSSTPPLRRRSDGRSLTSIRTPAPLGALEQVARQDRLGLRVEELRPGRTGPPSRAIDPRRVEDFPDVFCEITLHAQCGVLLAEPFQLGPFGLGQVLVGNPAGFPGFFSPICLTSSRGRRYFSPPRRWIGPNRGRG